MANFLELNGINVPCSADTGGSNKIEQVGESKRAVDGTMRVHRRVTKRTWDFLLNLQLAATAMAFRDLVLGKGHYWSFDDTTKGLYSSKGLGPTGAITGVTLGTSSPAPYLGGGRLAIAAAGTPNNINYVLGACVAMTVMVARNVNSAGWNHTVADSAGNVWTNGVLTGTATWLTITPGTGTVRLTGDTAFPIHFDELVILPFKVPTDWPAQMYAFNNAAKQWGPLAQLKAAGNGIEGNLETVTVKGEPSELMISEGAPGGTYTSNLAKMKFSLDEI